MARFFVKTLSEQDYADLVMSFNVDCNAGGDTKAIAKPDPLVVFDHDSRTVRIEMSYADLMDRYANTKAKLVRLTTGGEDPRANFVAAYGSDEEKAIMRKYLEDARDKYRNFAYPNLPDPNIDPTQSQAQQTAALLTNGANPGLVLGGGHGDQETTQLLLENMQNGAISSAGGTGLVFLEEIKSVFQPVIDEYLDGPDDAEVPKPLKALFDKLKSSMPNSDFEGILKLAKVKKVRLYGVDTGDASPDCENTSALHPEQRCARMNFAAEKIIKGAQAKYPGQKFTALVGAAHSNTHAGGIPGLAQIFNAPSVRVDPLTGKLQWDQEVPGNRRMPEPFEQVFVEGHLQDVETKAKAAFNEIGVKFGKDVKINKQEVGKKARDLAAFYQNMGSFPTEKHARDHVQNREIQRGIAEYVELLLTRHQRRNDLKGIIAGGDAMELTALLPGFLLEDPALLTTEGEATGTTLMHEAAKRGQDTLLAVLIAQGGNVNAMVGGESPMHLASTPEAVRMLGQNGANPNLIDKQGRTAVGRAADGGNGPLITELIAQGGDVNRPDYGKQTPLQASIAKGHAGAALALVAGNANVNVVNATGQTALHEAAAKGLTTLIQPMIAAGGNINLGDANGDTPLLLAIASGKTDTAQEVLVRGGDANQANTAGKRPIHAAAEKGQTAFVQHLAANGGNLALTDGNNRTGLKAACIEQFKQQARQQIADPQQTVRTAKLAFDQANSTLQEEQRRLQEAQARQNTLDAEIREKDRKGENAGAQRLQWLEARTQIEQALQAVQNATNVRALRQTDLDNAKLGDPVSVKLAATEALLQQAQTNAAQAEQAFKNAETLLTQKEELVRARQERFQANPSALLELRINEAVAERDTARQQMVLAQTTAQNMKKAVYPLQSLVREMGKTITLAEEEIDQLAEILADDALRAQPSQLTSLNDIAGVLALPAATNGLTTIIDRTIGREANKKQLLDVIKSNDMDAMKVLLNYDPYMINQDLDPQGAPGSLPLHLAAKEGNMDLLNELLTLNADLGAVSQDGRNVLHVLCNRRVEMKDIQKQGVQLAMVKKLVGLGVEIDQQDRKGRTPLHLAAINPNAGVVSYLLDNGADETIRDNRGWKASDVVVATTKPQTEEAFYEHSKDPNVRQRLIRDDETNLDTVTVLMRATKCENPQHVAKIEEAYRELYAQPLFRPIMDLAALDACLERRAPLLDDENDHQGGGLRIFVADFPQVGMLYNVPREKLADSPQGAFEEGANVLMVGGQIKADSHYLPGTLIHEMTHMAARVLYGQDVIPCPPGLNGHVDALGKMKPELANSPYVLAIQKDMRAMALMEPTDPVEKKVYDVMADRMKDKPYRGRGDLAFLQEFLVGVPQLIAEHGIDVVQKFAPELTSFFTDTFLDKVEDVIESDRYSGIYDNQFDNAPLIVTSDNRPVRPTTSAETWLTNKSPAMTPEQIAEKIKTYYVSQKGNVVVPPDGFADKTSLPYSLESFQLDPAVQDAFDEKMRKVTIALSKAMAGGALPQEVSADVLRSLVKDTAELIGDNTVTNLSRAVTGRVAGFQREAAKTYLEQKIKLGQEMSDREVAEIVLMRAEDTAWKAAHPLDDGIPRPLFNAKDHARLAAKMELKIRATIPQAKWTDELVGDPLALEQFIHKQAKALTKAQRAVYTRNSNPDKVVLDEKRAKNAWYAKLQQLA